MKLDNTGIQKVDAVEERPIKTEYRHLASFRIYKGQQCWSMNILTGEVAIAKIEQVNADLRGKVSNKVLVEDGFIYAAAINKENAERKLVQQLFSMFQKSTNQKFVINK